MDLAAHLVATAKNPIPIGGAAGRIEIKRSFGRRRHIRYARWPSVLRERRGTIVIFPGRAEFIEKYFELTGELRRRGFAVAILDWRGQGGSSRLCGNRLKGHVGSFADYQTDIFRFMNEVVLPDCPPPYYALAHSMGGAIALQTVAQQRSWFDRLVLSAPMLGLHKLPVSPDLLLGLTGAVKLMGLSRLAVPGQGRMDRLAFEGNLLTTDPERFARNQGVLAADPSLTLGAPTFGWLRAALLAMRAVSDERFPARLKIPVLVLAAGNERIVCNAAIERFASRVKIGSHIVLRGASHELVQERDSIREEFLAALDSFLPGAQLKRAV